MICYNDMPLIEKAIKSVYDKVDKIIAVDGRYKDFTDWTGQWYSTDGTIEFLAGLPKVELRFAANLYESDKRNEYLKGLEDGQTVMVLDTDEIVEGDIPELKSDIGLVRFSELNDRREMRLATRLFRYRNGMKYTGVHFIIEVDGKLFNKRTRAEDGFSSEKVDTKIIHFASLRDEARKLYKSEYYKTLGVREAQYQRSRYD